MTKIWIITGPREVGKTRFGSHLLDHAQQQKLHVGGILCPPIYGGAEKKGISIKNLATGECFPLAKLRTNEVSGIITSRWVFDGEKLEWGNQVLRAAVPCDLLLIDELGPMEFEKNSGWQEGINSVDSRKYQTAVVVIRPELILHALKRWPESKTLEIPSNLEGLAEINLINLILDQKQ